MTDPTDSWFTTGQCHYLSQQQHIQLSPAQFCSFCTHVLAVLKGELTVTGSTTRYGTATSLVTEGHHGFAILDINVPPLCADTGVAQVLVNLGSGYLVNI